MTKLDALYLEHGQSAWVDNIRRDWLNDGTLQQLVDRGVRGVTSNPSIFAKALSTSTAYDELLHEKTFTDAEAAFEWLAIEDVRSACAILRPVYDASIREMAAGTRRSLDGFVSLEVSPRLAHDRDATVVAAERIAKALSDAPNLMIKIPATAAGLEALPLVLGLGISVNVTLIFSLERYAEVLDAYLEGLRVAEQRGHDLRTIASVASFFISRVDTAVDPLLPEHSSVRGISAVAQAAAAYELYLERIARPDFQSVLAKGAQVQRPLWASTSTKNPSYDDLLYVNTLVANETVNTLPDPTLKAYADHGDATKSALAHVELRRALAHRLSELSASGVKLGEVTAKLEEEGVAAFMAAYDELLATVAAKLAR